LAKLLDAIHFPAYSLGASATPQTVILTPASYSQRTSTSLHLTRSKKFSPKNKNDLGMFCHIPPLKKAKKQGEMPLPSLGPIPLKKCRI